MQEFFLCFRLQILKVGINRESEYSMLFRYRNSVDLLFFHRPLKRLVAVELKIGPFEASHKGQMELYLGWLDRYEKLEGENAPIGLILCAETSREEIELLNLDRDGILVAEYWTDLPPKEVFEQKIHALLLETQERMEQRKLLLPEAYEEIVDDIDDTK